jgi:hypothetical protein
MHIHKLRIYSRPIAANATQWLRRPVHDHVFLSSLVKHVKYQGSLVHLLSQQRIEGENPETEDQLVLDLEVHSSLKNGKKGGDTIYCYKCKSVLIYT